jgi:hypothetical protein
LFYHAKRMLYMRLINQTLIITMIAIVCLIVLTQTLYAQDKSDLKSIPSSAVSGRNIGEFLTHDGRFDLEMARRTGFQGSLNVDGFKSSIDTATYQHIFRPAVSASTAENPDDIYWDNSMSSSLPGVNGDISALTVYDGKLIAGGNFTNAGGISANCIAAWDGSSWSPLGSGMNNEVSALAEYDGKLIVGGSFTTAGGVSANCIAAWDGSSWLPLGSGMGRYNPSVYALTVYDNKLIAGGFFTKAGGVSANNIAAWDGSSWSPLSFGIDVEYSHHIKALTVYNGKLIAGGFFTNAGRASSANGIAAWDGSSWSSLGSGMCSYYSGDVSTLTVYDGKLIAGGDFTTAGWG